VFYRNDPMPDWVDFSQGLPADMASLGRLAIHYGKGKLRVSCIQGILETPLYEASPGTIVQPMVDDPQGATAGALVHFESYSVTSGPTTYDWEFFPAPAFISDPSARNPTVRFPVLATMYTATLKITDAHGVRSRTMILNPDAGDCRYASSVLGVSSEYGVGWFATSALGPPDFYPGYGDDPRAWASLTEDTQGEWIKLGFNNPLPINYINVYETFNPGSIYAITATNEDETLSKLVYIQPAWVQPQSSRIFTVTFPTTDFPVSRLTIYLDSQLVPGWNEIDAVGIGYCDLDAKTTWATTVEDFSSSVVGYSMPEYTLGAPDAYPAYGDSRDAWGSASIDTGPAWLELLYPSQPANVVRIVETFKPGAVTQVAVRNPGSMLLEPIYVANARPDLASAARNLDVWFAKPYAVSDVRIDVNEPAVPGSNQFDAMGIAQCTCTGVTVDVPDGPAPLADRLDPARPNPFHGDTEIGFTLSRGGPVRVAIYDVQGRQVARLRDAWLPAGRHTVSWNGRLGDGAPAAGGIYFVRLESEAIDATLKLVKVE